MKTITLDELLQLPMPERIRIVEAIWDSIADNPEALELSDEQKAEVDPRSKISKRIPTPALLGLKSAIAFGEGNEPLHTARNPAFGARVSKIVMGNAFNRTRGTGVLLRDHRWRREIDHT